ncbi:MAG TPA: hypothetical protein VNK92_04500, partial [Vicinamibacterales bacterium]|nr:hypothetical protein [Vicinamibacterales bacterium]
MRDLAARVRAAVEQAARPRRELVYEPEPRVTEARADLDRLAVALGGVPHATAAGLCLRIDRRYAPERRHGAWRIGDGAAIDPGALAVLDPAAAGSAG